MRPDGPSSNAPKRTPRFHRTANLAAALTRASSPTHVLRATLTHAIAALGAYAGSVFLLSEDREALGIAAAEGYTPGLVQPWQAISVRHLPNLPVTDSARDGQARFLRLSDLQQHYPHLLAIAERPYGSLATLPLKVEEHVLGVIALSFSQDREFGEVEQDFALTLADLCALAFERTRAEAARHAWQGELERQVQARTRELHQRNDDLASETAALQAFASFTEAVSRETQVDALTQTACELLRTAFGEGSTGYFARHDVLWKLRLGAGDFTADSLAFAQAGLPPTLSFVQEALRTREAVFVDDWRAAEQEVAAYLPQYGAVCVFPVFVGDRAVGLLTAGLTSTERWSARNKAVFQAVGRGLSLAAQRVETAEQVRRQAELLEARNRELETTTAQLRELNAELDAFSYSVSHDLRAPLRHVMGFVGLLRRSVAAGATEKSAHYLNVIEQATQRMNTLVGALLDFARTAREPLRLVQVDLGAVVAELRTELAPEWNGRAVAWRVGALPTVQGDRGLLRQVVLNLLHNAVKYTRTNPQAVIEVWAEREASGWAVHVRDNGVGFDEQYADKLFGAFQRLHRAEEFEGVGIGLANVQRIVARHGGRVWAAGRLGEGATFSFWLPHPDAGP